MRNVKEQYEEDEMLIPEIRDRLFALADEIERNSNEQVALLRALAEQTKRRPSVRTPIKSAPFTASMARAICRAKAHNPLLSNRELADYFNVNSGRISEALKGKRT